MWAQLDRIRAKIFTRPSVKAMWDFSCKEKRRPTAYAPVEWGDLESNQVFACRACTSGRAKKRMGTSECEEREDRGCGQLTRLVPSRGDACGPAATGRAKKRAAIRVCRPTNFLGGKCAGVEIDGRRGGINAWN